MGEGLELSVELDLMLGELRGELELSEVLGLVSQPDVDMKS
jgi:hypothetical protein